MLWGVSSALHPAKVETAAQTQQLWPPTAPQVLAVEDAQPRDTQPLLEVPTPAGHPKCSHHTGPSRTGHPELGWKQMLCESAGNALQKVQTLPPAAVSGFKGKLKEKGPRQGLFPGLTYLSCAFPSPSW